jgi:hypothetical protein
VVDLKARAKVRVMGVMALIGCASILAACGGFEDESFNLEVRNNHQPDRDTRSVRGIWRILQVGRVHGNDQTR